MPWYYVLSIIAGVFLVPIALGHYISRAVRLPEQSWRIGLVLFSLFAGTVVTIAGWPPKLGIDLSGGSILVYEVKDFKADVDMEKLIAAITLRVNPGGVKEVTIRPYGNGQIELIIPKATPDELQQIKDKISATGLLEFRILANTRDHADIITRARQLDDNVDQLYDEGDARELLAQWFPVLPAEVSKLPDAITRKNVKEQIEALVVMDGYNVNGGFLSNATSGIDEKGQPCVNFVFNSRGAKLFEGLTRDNLPDGVQDFKRQLSIILDGTIYSAPNIIGVISSRGQISGDFTREQTNFLSEVLTAGSLPTALRKDPSTELTTGPTLGADTIDKGVRSMEIATIAVVVFMLIYYRFAGVVANLALLLNVLLIVAFMILFKAAFTLSGLAGLALTVGMAVDANVLIYERMREELSRGATLRMAIRNGFGRATTTIIDANVTTLIAAVVLFAIGTDQVKGFAVTLILGILMNLFTAITCSRLLFDIAEKMRWITELRMLHILSNPNFDFIGKRAPAIALSLVVIAIGMVGVVARGRGLLDIDFTGGVSIEVVFAEPQDIAEVRAKLQSVGEELPDVTVQDVQIEGEKAKVRYVINTSVQDTEGVDGNTIDATKFVEDELERLFPGKLAVNHMTVKQVALIESRTPEKPAAPATNAKDKPAAVLPAKGEKFVGGAGAQLDFTARISQQKLEDMIRGELRKSDRTKSDVSIELTSPEAGFEAGSDKDYQSWNLKIAIPPGQASAVLKEVNQKLAAEPSFPSSNKIGAAVAGNTQRQAAVALFASMALIVIYVWFRFSQIMFGLAGIIALVHDVLVTLGALAVSYWLAPYLGFALVEPFKISLPVVAAFLTIIGYSINDTIVIFDRIREVRGKSPHISVELCNACINQTLSRTILTSLTVFIVVLILYAVGGQGIHGFAFAMVVGVVSGTYSTVYIATPLVLWMNRSDQTAPKSIASPERTTTPLATR